MRESGGVDARCRLCGGPARFAFSVGDRNRGLGDEQFSYSLCRSCHALAMTDVPEDLGRYYASDGYGRVGEEEMAPEFVRREEVKLSLLRPHLPDGPVVEIGPGPGYFTRVASRHGLEMTAIEMDARYCQALERVGVRAIQSGEPAAVLDSLAPSAAIVMWHVLEHLPDPWHVLDRAVANLKPNGVIAISMPNPDSLQFRLLGGTWVHVDAPRHLQLIPAGALEDRLARQGMRLAERTVSDPVGRDLNRQGWEAMVRRHPARRESTPTTQRLAIALTALMSPIENSGNRGTAYTSVFVRGTDAGPRDGATEP